MILRRGRFIRWQVRHMHRRAAKRIERSAAAGAQFCRPGDFPLLVMRSDDVQLGDVARVQRVAIAERIEREKISAFAICHGFTKACAERKGIRFTYRARACLSG